MTLTTWAKQVKELDERKCAYCGSENKLEAHHIKSRANFPELAFSLENGVTLCHECHYAAHGGNYSGNGTFAYRRLVVEPKIITAWLKEYSETRMILTVPKGDKDKIKAHAQSKGESVNAYINRLIQEDMQKI